MPLDTSIALATLSIGLLAILASLVFAKRIARGIAERRSRNRRVQWVAAIGTGSVADMRMQELRALARETARGAVAQEDLLSLLVAGRLPPRDDRRGPFERALRRGGLVRGLRRACGSRRAAARGRAALLWARLGLDGAERIVEPLMADPDPDVRAAATQALACCESEEAAWILLRSLRDGHVEPARVAERLTGAWAARPLLVALAHPAFAEVRPWLAEGLGLAGDPRGEQPLIRLLNAGDEEERIRACRALGRLGRSSSSPALMTALRDKSSVVRGQAAQALADLGEGQSVPTLVSLLADESWWARARAADALLSLGELGILALRSCATGHPDPYARERAVEALSRAPQRRLEAVVA